MYNLRLIRARDKDLQTLEISNEQLKRDIQERYCISCLIGFRDAHYKELHDKYNNLTNECDFLKRVKQSQEEEYEGLIKKLSAETQVRPIGFIKKSLIWNLVKHWRIKN